MFRFTIRDVLWLTVVGAMGVIWHRLAEQLAGRFGAAVKSGHATGSK
jgi:hypothetical protein